MTPDRPRRADALRRRWPAVLGVLVASMALHALTLRWALPRAGGPGPDAAGTPPVAVVLLPPAPSAPVPVPPAPVPAAAPAPAATPAAAPVTPPPRVAVPPALAAPPKGAGAGAARAARHAAPGSQRPRAITAPLPPALPPDAMPEVPSAPAAEQAPAPPAEAGVSERTELPAQAAASAAAAPVEAPGNPPGPAPAAAEGAPDAAAAAAPAPLPEIDPAARAALPQRLELRFDAYLESLAGDARIGSARFEMASEGGRYRMALDARGPLSSFDYFSEGILDGRGFRPERFTEKRSVAFRRRIDRSVGFVPAAAGAGAAATRADAAERAASAPVGSVDAPAGQGWLSVPPGTQDRLSVLLQLWLIARSHPERLVPGHEISLPLATMNKVDTASFAIGAVEPVALGERTVSALRLSRVRASGASSGIDVWLADDADRLPVALRYVEREQAVRFVAVAP